jgi:hypothetical protein
MHVTIRHYHTTDPDQVAQAVNAEFIPMLKQAPGFIHYYLLHRGDGWIMSVSIFDDQAGADNSTRMAADWVRQRVAPFVDGPPEVYSGDVLGYG